MSPTRPPLYFRLLRVRHLRPRSWTAFVLFEGSIVLGLLLALADIVNGWGVLAVPLAVAVMVKIHDSVAAAVAARPVTGRSKVPRSSAGHSSAHRLRAPAPRVVPAGVRPQTTEELAPDDAVPSARARPDPRGGAAIGVATVPGASPRSERPRPRPGIGRPESPVPALEVDGGEAPGDGKAPGNQGRFG
jgi:hypothetical protein